MNTHKKLIYQDDERLAKLISDLRHFSLPLTKLKNAFEVLEVGEFTNEVWEELRDKGPRRITEVYTKALEEDLVRTGVKNAVLQRLVLQGTEVPIGDLNNALKNIKAFDPIVASSRVEKLTIESISFLDGQFTVSESDREDLLEQYCRIYLNEEDREFYEVLIKLAECYESFMEHEKKLGTGLLTYNFSVLNSFLKINGTKLEINPEGFHGAVTYKQRAAKIRR